LGIVLLAGLLLAAVLSAWSSTRISTNTAILSLGLLMLLELGNVTTYTYQPRAQGQSFVTKLSENADIASFLREQIGPVRVEVNDGDIPYNFGDWYGIDHFGGYLASLTGNVDRVQGNAKARMMYGVNFQVGKTATRPGQVEVFTGGGGIKVFSNPAAFPRAWVVHQAQSIQSDDQINAKLDDAKFDPRRQTFVKGPAPQLDTCADPETAALVARQSGRVALEVNLKCRGMVIFSDTYFPGWQATVDGEPATLYEAYGFLRGVVAGAGPHRIEMRYRPKSVYWGASLGIFGLLGACLLTRLKW
jgi:uncharacterized membrane protein YfhO